VRAETVEAVTDMSDDLDDTLMREPEVETELPAAESAQDDVFSEALSELPEPEDALAGDDDLTDEDLDAELDFLADTDEAATKLDLARAYIDMGDQDGAKDILDEVVQEGSDEQKQEAEELLSRIG
jgi:pilus assembly protein FimV